MDGNRCTVKCHGCSFIYDVPNVAVINTSYLVDHIIFIRLIRLYYCDFIVLCLLIFIFRLYPVNIVMSYCFRSHIYIDD